LGTKIKKLEQKLLKSESKKLQKSGKQITKIWEEKLQKFQNLKTKISKI
jgi:hypothetical protein